MCRKRGEANGTEHENKSPFFSVTFQVMFEYAHIEMGPEKEREREIERERENRYRERGRENREKREWRENG